MMVIIVVASCTLLTLRIFFYQLKEKRKQAFLKTASDGRQRAKQKRFEEEMQRERQNQLDEEKRLYVKINLHNSLDLDLGCCM